MVNKMFVKTHLRVDLHLPIECSKLFLCLFPVVIVRIKKHCVNYHQRDFGGAFAPLADVEEAKLNFT